MLKLKLETEIIRMTGTEFRKYVSDRRCSNAISGIYLQDTVVRNLDLSGKELTECTFRNVQMNKTNFRQAKIIKCDFDNTNLNDSCFVSSTIIDSAFRDCLLRRCSFNRCMHKNCHFFGSDLKGADLDYSSWPLWCGSRNVKVDLRLARQLAAHFCALDCSNAEYLNARSKLLKFASKSHIAHHLLREKVEVREI